MHSLHVSCRGHSGVNVVGRRPRNYSNAAYVPEKYALPEACDYEFCQYLKLSGENIHFAVFDGKRASVQFHGLVLDYFREHVEQSSEKPETAGAVAMLGLM
jgi:hypothetical protein